MMTESEETAYEQGSRAAWGQMFRECLKALGYDGSDAERTRWMLEREAVVAALRGLCAEYGDNEWDEDEHLADVIEKHLTRHLNAPE